MFNFDSLIDDVPLRKSAEMTADGGKWKKNTCCTNPTCDKCRKMMMATYE